MTCLWMHHTTLHDKAAYKIVDLYHNVNLLDDPFLVGFRFRFHFRVHFRFRFRPFQLNPLALSQRPLLLTMPTIFHRLLGVRYSERSEVSTRARKLFCMASGRIFRVRLNFLSYSLRRFRPRRHVLLSQKLWPPSRWSCKAYKLLFGWTVLTG